MIPYRHAGSRQDDGWRRLMLGIGELLQGG